MGNWSYLQSLASDRMRWLSARQTAISSNVANANTPEYRAVDVVPFASHLDSKSDAMQLAPPSGGQKPGMLEIGVQEQPVDIRAADPDDGVGHQLEDEMIRSAEVHRDYSLTASIVKAQHRMLLTTVKG